MEITEEKERLIEIISEQSKTLLSQNETILIQKATIKQQDLTIDSLGEIIRKQQETIDILKTKLRI